ncbi:MAG: PIG-L family deacetylase [Polyangiaceae bacterium]
MTLVVLSPHLDDAVLSAGGAMLTAAAAGERVVAVTLFSECDGGGERRAEDARALGDARRRRAPPRLLDAPERLGLERSKRALCDAILDGADVDAGRRRSLPCSPRSRRRASSRRSR